MKFGINTYLFSSPFTNESTSYFPRFKDWGFDFVEIALEDPANIDPERVRKALDDNGLECRSVCAATGPGRDLRGTRKDQVTAIEYVEALIRIAPVLGSKLVAGPIYSAVGRAELVPDDEKRKQWDLVVCNLKILTDYAIKHGVKLAIEPLNRYETDFINTCDQALRMIGDVGSDALQVHLDTFHMNLEEKDPALAIQKAGSRLGLLHASGSDRGTSRRRSDQLGPYFRRIGPHPLPGRHRHRIIHPGRQGYRQSGVYLASGRALERGDRSRRVAFFTLVGVLTEG
jgi:D-psicose/D-tagatose/L-ribulose 3-epimerase